MSLNSAQFGALRSGLFDSLTGFQTQAELNVLTETLPIVGTIAVLPHKHLDTLSAQVDAKLGALGSGDVEVSAVVTALNEAFSQAGFTGTVSVTQDANGVCTVSFTDVANHGALAADTADPTLGLAGLPAVLSNVGATNVSVDYQLNFSTTTTSAGVFSLDTSGSQELTMHVQAAAPTVAGMSLGKLGFGVGTVTGGLDLTVGMDVTSTAFQSTSTVLAGSTAGFTLHVDQTLGAVPLDLGGSLVAGWQLDGVELDGAGASSLVSSDLLGVSMTNLTLKTDIVHNLLQPAFSKVATLLAPVEEVLRALDQDIPILAELGLPADLLSWGAAIFPDTVGQAEPGLRKLFSVFDFVDEVAAGTYDFGTISLNDIQLLGPAALHELQALGSPEALGFGEGQVPSVVQAFLDAVPHSDTVQFAFPVLQDLFGSVESLLRGDDIDLVNFNYLLPELTLLEVEQFFPIIGPLGIKLRGEVDLGLRVGFGLDTLGLYLDDHHAAGGTDLPEITFSGNVEGLAAVDLLILSAGGGAGISAQAFGDLIDPNGDGRVHFEEMNALTGGDFTKIYDIFSVAGRVSAYLKVYAEVDLFVWTQRWDYELARVDLVTFGKPTPAGYNPPLTSVGDGGGVFFHNPLYLNMGDRAGDRMLDEPADVDGVSESTSEVFKIEAHDIHVDGNAGTATGNLTITYNGYTNTVLILNAGSFDIIANGGSGDDTIEYVDNAYTLAKAVFSGGAGNDFLRGAGGNDELDGGAGNDVIHGGKGNDTIHTGFEDPDKGYGSDNDRAYGGEGDDLIISTDGYDIVEGGAGADTFFAINSTTISYVSSPVGVHLNLETGVFTGGDAQGDTLVLQLGITNNSPRIRGSDFDDVIVGRSTSWDSSDPTATENDVLVGGYGDDTLDGGAGNDFLVGGFGVNHYIGGSGTDVVAFNFEENTNVPLLLNLATGNHGNLAFGSTFEGIEGIQGTRFNDDITGYDVDATLANPGDMLYGGEGNDHLYGMKGNDLFFAEPGQDYIDGGTGTDTMSYERSVRGVKVIYSGATSITTGYSSLDPNPPDLPNGAQEEELILGDTIKFVENFIGTNRADEMRVAGALSGFTVAMHGGAGNDLLEGYQGAILDGGLGADTYRVGNGAVVVEDASDNQPTVVEILNGSFSMESVTAGSYTLKLLNDSKTATGSATLADTINGATSNLAQTLKGLGGNDKLIGGKDDTLIGGPGDDSYLFLGRVKKVAELAGDGYDTVLVGAQLDSFTLDLEVEEVTVLAGFTGTISGNPGNNVMRGDSGNDILAGRQGNDTLFGGGRGGDDQLYGGDGADILNGESGNDTLWADASPFNVGAEIVPAKDTLNGGPGNDILWLGYGGDVGNGGDGSDTYHVVAESALYETSSADVDSVFSLIDFTLPENFENLTLEQVMKPGTGATGFSLRGPNGTIVNASVFTVEYTGAHRGDGNAAANVLTANDLGNELYGYGGADTLVGGKGNDRLDGGTGHNVLKGGAGDDTYIIAFGSDDEIEELANQGTDTVRSATSWNLGANVENLTLLGTLDLNGGGNPLANRIIGNSGDNTLDAQFSNPKKVVADYLDGGAGNDTLLAGPGADILIGGSGTDELQGGFGDDTYFVDRPEDVVIDTGGKKDHVYASGSFALAGDFRGGGTTLDENIESLTLFGDRNSIAAGTRYANTITGNIGDNVLDSGATSLDLPGGAADVLIGGEGDDIYFSHNLHDKIVETRDARSAPGIDAVYYLVDGAVPMSHGQIVLPANVEYALVPGQTITGKLGLGLLGTGDSETLTGGPKADWLDGHGGDDTLIGGDGNDIYVLFDSSATITIVETVNGGIDLIRASYEIDLASFPQVENLLLMEAPGRGAPTHPIQGNALNNRIEDNSFDSIIEGLDGDDSLFGHDGDDQLFGGNDNDLLDGGRGHDQLIGGYGNDTYVVDAKDDSVEEPIMFGGHDTVRALVDYTLGRELEDLTLLDPVTPVRNPLKAIQGALDAVAGLSLSARKGFGNELDNVILGNKAANLLQGFAGSDTLRGGEGDDTLNGTDSSSDGVGEIDELTGGPGADLFILGKETRYYFGNGTDDYARITDFTPAQGDRLQLLGKASDYVLVKEVTPGQEGSFAKPGLSIYVDRDQNGAYTPPSGAFTGDDLVARLDGFSGGAKPNLGTFANFVQPNPGLVDLGGVGRLDLTQTRAPQAPAERVVLDFGRFDDAGAADLIEITGFRAGVDRVVAVEPPDHFMFTARTKYDGKLSTVLYEDTNDNGILDINVRGAAGGGDELLAVLVGTQLKTYGLDHGDVVTFDVDFGV